MASSFLKLCGFGPALKDYGKIRRDVSPLPYTNRFSVFAGIVDIDSHKDVSPTTHQAVATWRWHLWSSNDTVNAAIAADRPVESKFITRGEARRTGRSSASEPRNALLSCQKVVFGFLVARTPNGPYGSTGRAFYLNHLLDYAVGHHHALALGFDLNRRARGSLAK